MHYKNTDFCADDDTAALLRAIDAFVGVEIDSRWTRPEISISDTALLAIRQAAQTHGLLDASVEGVGLWSELSRQQPPALTLVALRRIARGNSAAAMHLHQCALAQAAHALLDANTNSQASLLPAPTALHLSGAQGWGGAALIRSLQGVPTEHDQAILADNYSAQTRTLWLASDVESVLLTHYHDGQFFLACHAGDAAFPIPDRRTPALLAHGLDGLHCRHWSDTKVPANSFPLASHQHRALITAHLLGLVAIAAGATDRAARFAHGYVNLRVQGGRQIIEHDAVAALIGDIDGALLSVDAQWQGLSHARAWPALETALSLKQTSMSLLCKAANAAVQVHGGSGYMRDTGVEGVLRDVNCLRVLGGSPGELALMLATERCPSAAQPEITLASGALPGFVPPTHPLSPLRAIQRMPLLRLLAEYTPATPWERDTNELPAPLARYREQIRDFAERHLRPHALALDKKLGEHTQTAFPPRPEILDTLLRDAGLAGLLSDLLPQPIGSVPWIRFRHALAWQQAIRTEELARADGGLMLTLSAHHLGLAPILFSGNLHVMQRIVLPALRACERGAPQLFAFAITEPAAGSDAEEGHGAALNRPGLVAFPVSGGWRLRGSKVFISGGDRARWVVAFAALAGEGFASWTAFLVDTESPGFIRVRNEHKMGMRASGATELAFSNCFVPEAHVLGGLRNGWALNRATLNFSRLPVAGMAVGFAQNATDIATDFACRTTLGGRPLLHYQQVQLSIADMQATTSSIRALVWQFAKTWTPWQAKASIAKFYATDQAQNVIEQAMDLCGDYGLLHENGLEKTFRDNRLTRIFEGTNQINRLAVIEDQQQQLLTQIARYHHHP